VKPIVKEFLVGAFAISMLVVIVTHSGGFARSIGAGGTAIAKDFKVLQGRG
jgi:hypothetical protein